jgi:beta-glucosidase/6-phospho-beta-glucosidase/beta-galactosidase
MRTLLLFVLLISGCPTVEEEPLPPAEPAFPDGFLWGTASAAWQAEGDFDPDPTDAFAVRSNWTVWTERGCVVDGQTNPQGAGFYTRYADDFALAASLGNTTYRLTIDWARVEPENDVWNEAEVDHYIAVLQAARAAGLTPMVTFWHWVMPTWVQNPTEVDPLDTLAAPAGPDSFWVQEFTEFVSHVAARVGDYADLYSILNEPFSVISAGYLLGDCGSEAFPPGGTLDLDGARGTAANLIFGHAAACDALRTLDTTDIDGDGATALCGMAATNNVIRPRDPYNEDDVAGAAKIDWIYNHSFMAALIDGDVDLDFDRAFTTTQAENPDLPIDEGHYPELVGSLDWHGVNYYGPISVVGLPNSSIGGLPSIDVADYEPTLPHSSLGFAIDPAGFGEILDDFAVYGLPIYITENGLGDPDDADRAMYLVEHLDQLQAAVARGVDVRGYYHWSLTDNFEWAHGFEQRFGLFRVDFEDPDLPRTRNRSADAYEEVVRANAVTDAIRASWIQDRYSSDGRL